MQAFKQLLEALRLSAQAARTVYAEARAAQARGEQDVVHALRDEMKRRAEEALLHAARPA